LKIGHQSEAVLENNLIKQLRDLSYASVKIQDCEALVANLQKPISFQRNHYYCQKFDAILNHLAKGNVFEKTRRYETVSIN
jgi:type I restriction enzyme R subunit